LSKNIPENTWPTWMLYVACYTMWIALSALTALLFFQLRSNLVDTALLFGADRWVLPAIHNFGVVVLGIVCLGVVLWLEVYLHAGVDKGNLFRRAGKALAWLGIALGISYLLQLIIPSAGMW
jgi:hypothetical protein